MRLRAPRSASVLALLLPFVAAAQSQDEDPAVWLVKMSEAARSANYQGVVIYRGDEMLETFRVTHRYQQGLERERVQSLTGEPREVEKQDNKLTCLLPKTRRTTVDHPTPKGLFPGLTPERVQQIATVYEFDNLGQARVAGRVCRGIAITPRDQYRYGYEVWADEQTAVPLRVNLRGRDGVVLEQMMFTEVDFPASIPDSAFAAPEGNDAAAAAADRPAGAAPPAPVAALPPGFGSLPPGFKVTLRDVREVPGKGLVEHWLLSDGLSAISVFTTRRTTGPGFQGVSQIGALNAYGRAVGSFHITVVGEVPPQTVKMVGDGVTPPDTQPPKK